MAIRLWDVVQGVEISPFPGFHSEINALAFAPDGRSLASACQDGRVRLWCPASKQLLRQVDAHLGGVKCLAFSPDGTLLATGGADQALRFWDPRSGDYLAQFLGQIGWITALAFSPDGEFLASGGQDRVVRLWRVVAGTEESRLSHDGRVESVAFAPDGESLVSGCWDRLIRVWNPRTGQLRQTLLGHLGAVKSVAFTRDGHTLASGGADGLIQLWDHPAGRAIKQLPAGGGVVISVVWSPDDRFLASQDNTGRITLWEVQTSRQVWQFQGHQGLVSSIAFAPDGKVLASASVGGSLEHQAPLERLPGPPPQPTPPQDLEPCWEALAGQDPLQAIRAARILAADPARTLPFLQERLHPVVPVERSLLEPLFHDLIENNSSRWDSAREELLRLGEVAEPWVRRLREMLPEGKARDRIQEILARMKARHPTPETLRGLRVLALLARIDTPEAWRLLEAIARGAPEVVITQEAQSILARRAVKGGQ